MSKQRMDPNAEEQFRVRALLVLGIFMVAVFTYVAVVSDLPFWPQGQGGANEAVQVERPEQMTSPYAQFCFLIPDGLELPVSVQAKTVGGRSVDHHTEIPLFAQEAEGSYCGEVYITPQYPVMMVTIIRDPHYTPDFEELWVHESPSDAPRQIICTDEKCEVLLYDRTKVLNVFGLEPPLVDETRIYGFTPVDGSVWISSEPKQN